MLNEINPSSTASWKKLGKHYEQMKATHMRDLFNSNAKRFEKFSLQFEDILLDYSKNILTAETLALLLSLADECELADSIIAMFAGGIINQTEKRAVLHTALRLSLIHISWKIV